MDKNVTQKLIESHLVESIEVPEANGDKQAAKEITVYARRIEKSVDEDRNRSDENG